MRYHAWPHFASDRRLSEVEASRPTPAIERRISVLVDVVYRLPPGPFTATEFLDHAIGLNAIGNASEVDAVLARLTELDVIRPADDWNEPRWVAVS